MKTISRIAVMFLCMLMVLATGTSHVSANYEEEPHNDINNLSDSGYAYAVLTDSGELVFFRSTTKYMANEAVGTFSDLNGTSYKGTIYTQIESATTQKWSSKCKQIKSVRVADGQLIRPSSTASWFGCCENMTKADLTGFDTSNVKDMSYMFFACGSLNDLEVTSLNTDNVTNMDYMFARCLVLNVLDISSFNTAKVTSMAEMFEAMYDLYCVKLGKQFTVWRDNAYLPTGTWKKGTQYSFTEKQLYNQYPSNTSSYNGYWYKDGIFFIPGSMYVNVGETRDFTLKVTMDKDHSQQVEISPRDDEFATVQAVKDNSLDGVVYSKNCTVTGKKVGSTDIIARTKDGTYSNSGMVYVLFNDVPRYDMYYSQPVYWAVRYGITNGYYDSDGLARTFKPQSNCTREAVVTFLWRLAGKPEPKSTVSKFSDVQDSSKYYYKAVLWAAEQGITNGYADGTFKPSATCLREHVVTFLWRYAGKPTVSAANTFTDVTTSDYYYMPVLWAAQKGITKGYADDNYKTFRPKNDCLREHVVTFLYRYATLK